MCVTIAFNYRSLCDAIRYATATYTVDTAEDDDGFSGAQRQFWLGVGVRRHRERIVVEPNDELLGCGVARRRASRGVAAGGGVATRLIGTTGGARRDIEHEFTQLVDISLQVALAARQTRTLSLHLAQTRLNTQSRATVIIIIYYDIVHSGTV